MNCCRSLSRIVGAPGSDILAFVWVDGWRRLASQFLLLAHVLGRVGMNHAGTGCKAAYPAARQREICAYADFGLINSGKPDVQSVNWKRIAFWAAMWWFVYSAPTEDPLARFRPESVARARLDLLR